MKTMMLVLAAAAMGLPLSPLSAPAFAKDKDNHGQNKGKGQGKGHGNDNRDRTTVQIVRPAQVVRVAPPVRVVTSRGDWQHRDGSWHRYGDWQDHKGKWHSNNGRWSRNTNVTTWVSYDWNRPDSDGWYYADRYYRPIVTYRTYQPIVVTRQTRIYRGSDNRYYCRRSDGTTGLIVGAALGGVIGNRLDRGRSSLLGTLIGAAAGATLGREIDRGSVTCR